jgi:hypothetical protein
MPDLVATYQRAADETAPAPSGEWSDNASRDPYGKK